MRQTRYVSENLDELMSVVRQGRARVSPRTEAIVVLLHGGRAEDLQPNRFRDISYLRMLPFARVIRRESKGSIAPVLVHNQHGGWVASSGSGIVQARELIRRLYDEHGRPIVLLGHSSGGWVALRAGGEDAVLGSVALAPWVAEDEPTQALVTKKVRVIHGDADTICSPVKSREFVERLQGDGGDASYRAVAGGGHALMDHPGRWHALAADAVAEVARAGGERVAGDGQAGGDGGASFARD